MTATVKEFCRVNGLDERSENLVDKIFNALCGGDADRHDNRPDDSREENKAPIPDRLA